ncbi:uncharacterized protein LOC124136486 [Haliotis rufescens]|uniref:uncharacterized protein LOC124136486 n=1 Tax=Haliotis rufescens TaxID=6454 RepID=UPI001EB01F74|nr:uncharacterized protein LOC124136486 [Haliotis rufescens]
MWNKFLRSWNGISLFHDKVVTDTQDFNLFTDAAATVGHGGYFQVQEISSPGSTSRRITTPVPTQLSGHVDLNYYLYHLWSAAISQGTRSASNTGFNCYMNFLLKFGLFCTLSRFILPPVNKSYLQYFIAHCFGVLKLQHYTVKTYLAGIRFSYLQAGVTTLFDEASSGALNRLQALMRGFKKLQTTSSRKRLPITYPLLSKIVYQLCAGIFGPYDDFVMECMCVTAFFGLFDVENSPALLSSITEFILV